MTRAVRAHLDDPVGVLDDPFEPVLGQQHGDAEVVDQPGDRGQHLLGRRRVEGRGRLVEDQDAGVGGQHRADGDPLLLAAGELVQRPVAQLGDAEQVEGLLDPLAHDVGRDGQLLHAVGQLLLDRVGDEAGQRVLADDADDVGQLPGLVGPRVAAVDRTRPASVPPVKWGTSPLTAPSSVDLPTPGPPDDERQLALVDAQVHVAQHRRRRRRRR